MPSPIRRSTRGAPPSNSKHTQSTSVSSPSSLSSTRNERKTAHHHKAGTPRSLSSEEASEPPRRSQRSAPHKDDAQDDMDGDDAIAEEEEVTRCICGQQDYPGPPLSEAFDGVDNLSEDTGGLFIQCDGCSVWQHGGCVGIIEESQSPDKYYCEECKPKQHELHTDSRGQNYSLYIPLHPRAARKGSFSKSDERRRETTASRASADPVTGRRRATTRSKEHDEEEEAFQRALEESKREAEGSVTGRRSGKRGRDETDEVKQEFKRQRTLSDSRTPATRTGVSLDEDSEDDAGDATSTSKKLRAEVAQSIRQVQIREKEDEREKARIEAAGRRQERAGRRRGDELDNSDDTPNPTSKPSPPPSSQAGSPEPTSGPKKTFPRRGKKSKKLGNNQYTKNRDGLNQLAASPHSKKRLMGTNVEASSGDEQSLTNGDSNKGTTRNSPGGQEPIAPISKPVGGRFGKGKYKNSNGAAKQPEEPVEKTYANMKHSLTAMVMFVQKQQADLANGDRTPPGSNLLLAVGGPVQLPNGGDKVDRPFSELSSFEMAGVFSRNVQKWTEAYGHLA
ncbi:Hypothetical protein R9X50_00609300 [Acrodontium crateriforme]|uniref:Zinc finger PHD-type domain-containing protein n=1 Tax=Acrodontium crateriforme TaxID=150365 RepID=A0AAQ3R6I5_9PEZI|nr:Hypothetical protein R9X50_00609300 [Acrodontium crateriforme]